jgi:EmrB/QacA subfamily drug resistance transporter
MTAHHKWLIFTVTVAFFIENLDTSILNTAIPMLAHSLNTSPLSVKGALTAYLILLAIVTPLSGWLANRIGDGRLFQLGFFIFTVSSFCAGFVSHLSLLIFFRSIEGIGGAFMVPVARGVLMRHIPTEHRLEAVNRMTVVALIAPLLGPVVGGAIVSYLSWRWIFWIHLPFGLLGIWLVKKYVPNYVEAEKQSLDFVGYLLIALFIAAICYIANSIEFSSHFVVNIILAIIAALSLFLFLHYRKFLSVRHPFIPSSLFEQNAYRNIVIARFFISLVTTAPAFLLPIIFQLHYHMNAFHSGLLLLPLAMGALSAKLFVNRLYKKYGFKKVLYYNSLALAFCIFMLGLSLDMALPVFLVIAYLWGTLASIEYTGVNVWVFKDLPPHLFSIGNSLYNTIQQLGFSFGVVVSALLLMAFSGSTTPDFSVHYRIFFATFFCLGLIMLAPVFFIRRVKE